MSFTFEYNVLLYMS